MSETTEIWVSVSIKKNLGNYESLGIDAGLKETVGFNEDVKEVWKKAWIEVEAQIEDRLQDSGLKK